MRKLTKRFSPAWGCVRIQGVGQNEGFGLQARRQMGRYKGGKSGGGWASLRN